MKSNYHSSEVHCTQSKKKKSRFAEFDWVQFKNVILPFFITASAISISMHIIFVLVKMWLKGFCFIFFSSLTFNPFVNNNTQRNPIHQYRQVVTFNCVESFIKKKNIYIESTDDSNLCEI